MAPAAIGSHRYWALAGGAGLLLGGGLLWWLWRRRRSPVADAEPTTEFEPEPVLFEPPAPQPLAVPATPPLDPLDEARQCLIDGDVPQALLALRTGLVAEPMRQDLRLMLLEVLANRGAEREFVEEALVAKTLFGSDSVLWQLAGELSHFLRSVPPLFRDEPVLAEPPVATPVASTQPTAPVVALVSPIETPVTEKPAEALSAELSEEEPVASDERAASILDTTPSEPAKASWAAHRLSLEERRKHPPEPAPSLEPYRDGLKALESLYAKWEVENGVTGKKLPRKK